MVQIAVDVMLGASLRELGYEPGLWPERDLVAIKAPVFSMSKLTGVDTYLGPEMKSTGEVMGIDRTYERALAKALLAADAALPPEGAVLLSIADRDKPAAISMIRHLGAADYAIFATAGTADLAKGLGLEATVVPRLQEGDGTNVVDIIPRPHGQLRRQHARGPAGAVARRLRDPARRSRRAHPLLHKHRHRHSRRRSDGHPSRRLQRAAPQRLHRPQRLARPPARQAACPPTRPPTRTAARTGAGALVIHHGPARVLSTDEIYPGTFVTWYEGNDFCRTAYPGQFVMVQPRDGLDPLPAPRLLLLPLPRRGRASRSSRCSTPWWVRRRR